MKSNALKHKSSSEFRSIEVFTILILFSQVSLPPIFQCLSLHLLSSFEIFSPSTFSALCKSLAQHLIVSMVCLIIKFQVCQVLDWNCFNIVGISHDKISSVSSIQIGIASMSFSSMSHDKISILSSIQIGIASMEIYSIVELRDGHLLADT